MINLKRNTCKSNKNAIKTTCKSMEHFIIRLSVWLETIQWLQANYKIQITDNSILKASCSDQKLKFKWNFKTSLIIISTNEKLNYNQNCKNRKLVNIVRHSYRFSLVATCISCKMFIQMLTNLCILGILTFISSDSFMCPIGAEVTKYFS